MASNSRRRKSSVTGWSLARRAGEQIEVSYPLPVTTEDIAVGNPGHRQYRYRVTWKGDTVVRIEPTGEQYTTGFSDFDEKQVKVFYGKDGPGRLYQRDWMLKENVKPELAPLQMDRGPNFWLLRQS